MYKRQTLYALVNSNDRNYDLYISHLPNRYIDFKILPTCLFLPYVSFDVLHDDIWMTLKFDLFGSQNDLEIFSGIHPSFSVWPMTDWFNMDACYIPCRQKFLPFGFLADLYYIELYIFRKNISVWTFWLFTIWFNRIIVNNLLYTSIVKNTWMTDVKHCLDKIAIVLTFTVRTPESSRF